MEYDMNYRFGDKLIELRREKGLSQEQLAAYLDVSRQAVSKWEAAQTMPSIDKIIQIADLFGVSVDYLVRENTTNEDKNKTVVTTIDDTAVMAQLDEIKAMVNKANVYEHKSKITVFGFPLVHIKFSNNGRLAVAKGIIAIGNMSIGVVSIGAISVGLLSLGAISFGLLLAFGGIAIGAFALGGLALGAVALGGVSIGIYSFGGLAVAKEIAAGGVANGNLAIGTVTFGEHMIDSTCATKEEVKVLIKELYPNISSFFLRIILSTIK